ncbi:MAG: hypothetical protein D6732_16680 [Methanobacteriota archaeon]|nr:MAG: hypothetical protein D6732_16680 [Euryarchaeota archaeon]
METSIDRDIISGFLEFFKNFQDEDGQYKYSDEITRIIIDGERSLVIDYNDLYLMDSTHELGLSSALLEFPEKTIELGTIALETHIKEENFDYFQEVKTINRSRFHVRFVNIPSKTPLRNIRTNQLGTFRAVEAIVVRTTEIKPMIDEGFFICKLNPEHQFRYSLNQGTFSSPRQCIEPSCKSKDFTLSIEDSTLIDWQGLTLQERPEELPSGTSPKSLNCRLLDDLVDKVRPGDRVIATGIVRTKSPEGLKKGKQAILDIWLDVNYIEPLNKETDLTEISLAEEAEFYELAENPDIYEMIIHSLAPQIKGLEREKEAIMYFLFGGVDKLHPNGFKNRGQPNILLVGDPGVAKSQLLKAVHKVAPRGVYTSGKGSSAAGLTAAIVRDPDTGELTLEAGAMVLADKGVCLTGDTEIMLGDGRIMPIEEIYKQGRGMEILSFNQETLEQEIKPVKAVSRRFSKKIYELTFETGDVLKASPEHPFPVWENGIVWKSAEDLAETDLVIDYRRYRFNGEPMYNPSIIEFLGYLICLDSEGKIKIHQELEETIFRIKSLAKIHNLPYKHLGDSIQFEWKLVSPRLKNSIGRIITGKKDIIAFLYQLRPEELRPAITALANLRGRFTETGNFIIAIEYGMAEPIRKILRKVGVASELNGDNINISDYSSLCRLSSSRFVQSLQVMFNNQIRKRRRLNEKQHGNNLLYQFPELEPLIEKGQQVMVGEKTQMIEPFEETAIKFVTNDLAFNHLVKKRELPGEKVYNLQVEDSETYFANFIPVHNCLIDEFDKMSENDRSAIHEAMEQQTISVAKAGIVATLNSRTGVLAAANPVHGRYEDHRTFVENVDLGPTILSRFDLIFILRDIPDEKEDESKAMHILNLHMNYDTNLVEDPPIPLDKLKKYIMFAKQKCEPRLTQEAINTIQEFYVNLRNNVKRGDRNAIPITARQLEGIVRLAEARARVALRDKVTKQDAQKAIDLMVYSLQQIAIDPETGELDYDAFASGHTSTKRSRISRLMSIIENLQSISSGPFEEKDVYREAEAEGLDLEFVQKAIYDLVRQGALYRPEAGKLSKL